MCTRCVHAPAAAAALRCGARQRKPKNDRKVVNCRSLSIIFFSVPFHARPAHRRPGHPPGDGGGRGGHPGIGSDVGGRFPVAACWARGAASDAGDAGCATPATATTSRRASRRDRRRGHHHGDLARAWQGCHHFPALLGLCVAAASQRGPDRHPATDGVRKKKGGEVGIFQPPLQLFFSHAPPPHPINHRYLSWDDYFMALAFLSAQRSKDPSKQVCAQHDPCRPGFEQRVYARSCVGGLGHNIFSILTPATPP